MEILDYDLEKRELRSLFSTTVEKFDTAKDFQTWEIISTNQNQQVLLQREESGRFHAAEGDLRRKQIHEVREVSYRGPNGEVYVFDEDSGIIKI